MEGSGIVWKKGADMKTCQETPKSLPAPTADGVVRTFTIDDKDPSIDLKVGQKFAIALVGVPTAGYIWGAEAPPALVKVSDGPGGPTSSSQLLPGFAGGNHWEVVIVEATAAGQGEVTLVQKRPWEDKADPDANRYKVKVKVAAN
jgi:predicted secreted protein